MSYASAQGAMVDRVCQHCGTEFSVPQKSLGQGRGKFCKVACSNASRAGNAKSHSRLRGIARQVAMDRGILHETSQCGHCLKPVGMRGHIHHRDEDPTNNNDVNLCVLCRTCHIAHHNKEHPKRLRRLSQQGTIT